MKAAVNLLWALLAILGAIARKPTSSMVASAAIANPLLRQAFGRRARHSVPPRALQVRLSPSYLHAPVSRRGCAISRRIAMNVVGCLCHRSHGETQLWS